MVANDALWVIDKPILVPLTTSLYVPGTLADNENVIVDVGTGFYVEKVRHIDASGGMDELIEC
jgi:prefoldin alpha subunit